MFKSRRKKAEEEAKLEENYRPTEELEAEEVEEGDNKVSFARGPLIVALILLGIVAILMIVIFVIRK